MGQSQTVLDWLAPWLDLQDRSGTRLLDALLDSRRRVRGPPARVDSMGYGGGPRHSSHVARNARGQPTGDLSR